MPSFPGGVGLMLGLPHDGKPVTMSWAFHFKNLQMPMNYDVRMTLIQGKPVDEARNDIVEAALQQKCKYVFFNDSDVTCPPHTIMQLIWHLEHYPKYAVAGAIYCHKNAPQMPMVFRGNGQGPYMDWKVGEVFDISGIGMGATLIRTEVFNQVTRPFFKTVIDHEAHKDGINRSTMWTEDLYFCEKVNTQTEFSIMADGGLLCEHWDTMSNTAYSLPLNSKPWRMKPTKGRKVVDLGCGEQDNSYTTDEGDVLRVDIRESVNPDYRCDVRQTPFATGEFDVVFSSHTLEHFTRFEATEVVKEMARILKPDGELRLVVPNIAWAAQHIMNKEIDANVMNVLYGQQSYAENYHYSGYTPEMLEQLLKANGFVSFTWEFVNYHMAVRASTKEDHVFDPNVNKFSGIQTVRVARMIEHFKDGHDPYVKVKENEGSIEIHAPKTEEEALAELGLPTLVGDLKLEALDVKVIDSDSSIPDPVSSH